MNEDEWVEVFYAKWFDGETHHRTRAVDNYAEAVDEAKSTYACYRFTIEKEFRLVQS